MKKIEMYVADNVNIICVTAVSGVGTPYIYTGTYALDVKECDEIIIDSQARIRPTKNDNE